MSCEHATNRVPARYRQVLRGASRALASHRGWDPGAIELARRLARCFGAPLHIARASRLVVDTNRSEDHPRVFSEWSRRLAPSERTRALDELWRPHRSAVEASVRARAACAATHVSVHSFTPRLDGRTRTVDIGLLFDPARAREVALVDAWIAALGPRLPGLRIHRNRPYRGTSDGLTTALRKELGGRLYAGIEVEISQRIVRGDAARWRSAQRAVIDSLADALRC